MPLKDLSTDLYNYAVYELTRKNSWMEFHTGDITKYINLDIIIHQANCFHLMQAGVANVLLENYPEIGIEDKKTKYGDPEKLGHYTACLTEKPKNIIIFNVYSQFKPGSSKGLDENNIDSAKNRLNYLECALKSIVENIEIYNINNYHNIDNNENINTPVKQIRIGIPWLIGCGIAGGNIDLTFNVIKNVFEPFRKDIKIVFIDIKGEPEYA